MILSLRVNDWGVQEPRGEVRTSKPDSSHTIPLDWTDLGTGQPNLALVSMKPSLNQKIHSLRFGHD